MDRIGLCILLALVGSGCREPQQTVVLDGWWSADYAKVTCNDAREWHQQNAQAIAQLGCESIVSCPEMMPLFTACATDPVLKYRSFEDDLSTAFAVERRCNGITFVRFHDPEVRDRAADEAMAAPHWMLGIDFTPGGAKQAWWINDAKITPRGKGVGTSREIARAACDVVNARGAKLAN